ncbi:MAG: glycosyltransferase family 4 protein [Verrucomicrobiota bacterium]|nr:glycosyltransferase family 4 protein [Verrucomicrobiota bacterium]
MVLLIGNYAPDQQQSMQRFGTMMLEGLLAAGIPAELIKPEPCLGNFRGAGAAAAKWLGYIDKFLVFPWTLKAKLAAHPAIVHIADHSNAVYVSRVPGCPVVVTCHDLLAVRGGLGEATDCPASFTGRILQRWILRGLQRATAVACDSRATLEDAKRLLGRGTPAPQVSLVTLGLSYRYRMLDQREAMARVQHISGISRGEPFVLHVGSNLRRKNREAVLRIFGRCKPTSGGKLVFAGDPLTAELRALAAEQGIAADVVEVVGPTNETLEALYNCATALIYPSRFEGFGWPIAEAQACGCPVVCSNREPLPEVGGDAVLTREVEDEAGFAADVLRLTKAEERAIWSAKSLQNATRFSAERMVAEYIELYRTLAPAL